MAPAGCYGRASGRAHHGSDPYYPSTDCHGRGPTAITKGSGAPGAAQSVATGHASCHLPSGCRRSLHTDHNDPRQQPCAATLL